MFALIDHYGKQHAHEIIYENAMIGIEKKTFKEVLLANKRVYKVLKKEIDALLDATTYVGYAPKLVDEFLAKIKNSDILADFIFNLKYENIPNTVVQRAK